MIPRRLRRLCNWAPFAALLLALSGFAAGCGGSSGGGGHGPADKFVGRWELDPDTGPYHLINCSDDYYNNDGVLWTELLFEYGELTDLSESSGICSSAVASASPMGGVSPIPGWGYDVSGDTATLPDEDPYTGDAPTCVASVGATMEGYPIGLQLSPKPNSWRFKLEPVASGEPRRAVLGKNPSGDAVDATFFSLDGYGAATVISACQLTGETTFFRVSTE
jgi:hypothetical protein